MPRKYVKKKDRETKEKNLPPVYESGFLQKLDGRTNEAKILRNRFDELAEDLGGASALSGIKRSLLERFVFLEALCGKMEYQMLTATDNKTIVEIQGKHTQMTNALSGLATKLGLNKVRIQAWANPVIIEPESDDH